MTRCVLFTAFIAALILSGCTEQLSRNTDPAPGLVHSVYFALNDSSPTARDRLIADCYKYLSHKDGIIFFAAGPVVADHDRDVNVRDWDVALSIVFKTKAHHDAYQIAPDHNTFIEKNRSNWKSVRVFDSFTR